MNRMKFVLGTKQAMTQMYSPHGEVFCVTTVRVEPCVVTQIKTKEKDGYTAVQVGTGMRRRLSRPLVGHFKEGMKGRQGGGFAYVKEGRIESVDGIEKGDSIDLASFSVGEEVDVIGWSKGRGFTGVVKRHHFHGHPPTHGHKDQERMPGSIGAGGNQHVFKGTRMAGRKGAERITVKQLEIAAIDQPAGIFYIKGALPGARNSLVIVQSASGVLQWIKRAPFADESVKDQTPGQNQEQKEPAHDEAAVVPSQETLSV